MTAHLGTPADDALALILRIRVVPVVVLNDAKDAAPLGAALQAGGLPLAEVTLRTAAALESLRIMSSNPDIVAGAGTVITAAQVDSAVAAGARFIVSPGFSESVVERAREHAVPVIPGIATATELIQAVALGIDLVKFFPAIPLGGIPAIQALSSAFPGVRFVPTGGVSEQNASQFLAVDSVVAVGGSWMVPSRLISAGDFAGIQRLAREATELVSA
jgi:2-dehydro-3-deoxyphosphogluconate aldolase/(4S)-4-hydroxy-2-oxoglutarate aldolase